MSADVLLIRAVLDAAHGDLIHAADIDAPTVAALTRWLTPHGPADAPYWPVADVRAVLAGTD